MDGQQPADTVEREAPAQLDGREIRIDQRQQRIALATGHLGGDQSERLERELVELQLQHAAVFVLLRLEFEESAAAHAGRVDDEADAGRWLEAEREIYKSEVAATLGEGHDRRHTDAIHQGLDRIDRQRDARRNLDL
jgi:hypothetical protein